MCDVRIRSLPQTFPVKGYIWLVLSVFRNVYIVLIMMKIPKVLASTILEIAKGKGNAHTYDSYLMHMLEVVKDPSAVCYKNGFPKDLVRCSLSNSFIH